MLEETGCAGVSIGRGAFYDPWIFRRTAHLLRTGELLPEPNFAERVRVMRRHFDRYVRVLRRGARRAPVPPRRPVVREAFRAREALQARIIAIRSRADFDAAVAEYLAGARSSATNRANCSRVHPGPAGGVVHARPADEAGRRAPQTPSPCPRVRWTSGRPGRTDALSDVPAFRSFSGSVNFMQQVNVRQPLLGTDPRHRHRVAAADQPARRGADVSRHHRGDSPERRLEQLRMACVYMVAILVSFLIGGTFIMGFFGISIPGLRIAGGLLVAGIGSGMLMAPAARSGRARPAETEARAKRDVAFSPAGDAHAQRPGLDRGDGRLHVAGDRLARLRGHHPRHPGRRAIIYYATLRSPSASCRSSAPTA
jgi:hypothetical protein